MKRVKKYTIRVRKITFADQNFTVLAHTLTQAKEMAGETAKDIDSGHPDWVFVNPNIQYRVMGSINFRGEVLG